MDHWETLQRLSRMRIEGLLTEEEFTREKLRLFSGGADDWSSDRHPEESAADPSRPLWPWLVGAGVLLLGAAGGIGLLMAPAAVPVAHSTGKSNVPDATHSTDSDTAATTTPTQSPTSWKLPMPVSLLAKPDRDLILRSAGYTLIGGKWTAANAFGDDQGCPAMLLDQLRDGISPLRDLNGDGNPEVVTTSNGPNCYGRTGTAFAILTWTSGGWHKLLDITPGIPVFYPHPGSAWPDIEVQDSGFCFRRLRWSGTDYSGDAGHSYQNIPCGDSATKPSLVPNGTGSDTDSTDSPPITDDAPAPRRSQPGGVTAKRPSAPVVGTTGDTDSNAPY